MNLPPRLPIEEVLPQLKEALAGNPVVVLQAPPGAGKTTGIPPALLEHSALGGGTILMLEPRRLAARAAAARMAEQLGEPVGATVGYRVRFDQKVSAATRIEVVTEGILTRRLQDDPTLEGAGLVIFDEFHERHLESDLGLALCLDVQQGLREQLRLLVMSATLDGASLAARLNAPLLRSEGRSHPVSLRYLPRDPEGPLSEVVAGGIRRALLEANGDVLAFLPGAGEIRRVAELLDPELDGAAVGLHPLYGDLPFEAQQRALLPDPQGRRKVVLATPIAETSLTIEGVSVVVDSGYMRAPRFDPRRGLARLERVRISRASADQRAGRAGRLGPGICYRLWGENTQQGLIGHTPPEIRSADLAPLLLELAAWGVTDPGALFWIDPPPAGAMAQARDLLRRLGALDQAGTLTAAGRRLSALPLHPRLAHMLVEAAPLGLGSTACDIAALLSERDILRGTMGSRDAEAHRCDFAVRLEALSAYRKSGHPGAKAIGADPIACAAVEQAARQYRRVVKCDPPTGVAGDKEVGLLLALAYPDRVARLREGSSDRYQLAGGRGGRLPRECALTGTPWLVAAVVEGGGQEGLIRAAAPIGLESLHRHFGEQIEQREEIQWEAATAAVVARTVERFGAVILSEGALPRPDPALVLEVMLEGVRQLGLEALPWSDEARQLQARVLSLRQWLPEQAWPDLSDAALTADLDAWLAPYLIGVSRRDHLARLDLATILRGIFTWEQQQRLEQEAPTHLSVPSGSRKRLTYSAGQSPVLAVKLQEMFGLADTPTVARGRIPVTLHLLSPAQRPIQVTQDLRGFWERTYREVKRELKGRYPKHPWPDDPWNALPTAQVKRRE